MHRDGRSLCLTCSGDNTGLLFTGVLFFFMGLSPVLFDVAAMPRTWLLAHAQTVGGVTRVPSSLRLTEGTRAGSDMKYRV